MSDKTIRNNERLRRTGISFFIARSYFIKTKDT